MSPPRPTEHQLCASDAHVKLPDIVKKKVKSMTGINLHRATYTRTHKATSFSKMLLKFITSIF